MDSQVDLHYQTFYINKVKFVTDLLAASFLPIPSPLLHFILLSLILPLLFLIPLLGFLFGLFVLLSLFSLSFLGLLALLVPLFDSLLLLASCIGLGINGSGT